MANMYAGPTNVFVPAFDEQAKLIVNYSRNTDDYVINHLYTIVPTDDLVGKYLELTPEEQGAVNSNTGASSEWADGAPMPVMLEDGQQHDWKEFALKRYFRSFPIGWITKQSAKWDIVKAQSQILANKLMTKRAVDVYTILADSANYYSGNTATATVASGSGGKWDVATSTNRYIMKSLRYGAQVIMKATMGGVKVSDLVLVVGPEVAARMAESAEVTDFIAQNPDSTKFLEGKLFKDQYARFGLPGNLYGYTVLVDPLVKEARTNIGSTSSKSFVAGDDSAYLIARPGSLTSNVGGSGFSFLTMFTWKGKEMNLKVKEDTISERDIITVEEWRQIKTTGTRAGFLYTDVMT